MGSSQAANVDLDWASLKSDIRRQIDKDADYLLEKVIRTFRKAYEDRLIREIEAQWGQRCKDWLNQQLAQQRAEVATERLNQDFQHWVDTEGARLRKRYCDNLDEAYHTRTEKEKEEHKLSYKKHWDKEERHKYRTFLRTQLAAEVKAELKEELKPTVTAELRASHLPALQEEARWDIDRENSQYKHTSQFAQSVVGPRLRAQNSKRDENADRDQDCRAQNSLGQTVGASNRLNSVLDHGPPIDSESRQNSQAGAYQGGLFGIFPLGTYDPYEHTYQPQPVQPSYVQNATAASSNAVKTHGIVGQPIIPRRVQALKDNATVTTSAIAPSTQSHQPTPASGTVQPFNSRAAGSGTMQPPPRPTGERLPRHLQPARIDQMNLRVITESTSPLPSYRAGETSAMPMLMEAHNPVMAPSSAPEQTSKTQSEVVNTQAGESHEPTSESLICDKANEVGCGGPGPAVPAASTNNTDVANIHTHGQEQDTTIQTRTTEITGVPSPQKGKKRALPEADEAEDAGARVSESKTRDEAAKPKVKRTRLNPAQQIEGPGTRTRAAARKAAAEKLEPNPKKRNPAASASTNTTIDTGTPAGVMDSAAASALVPAHAPAHAPASASRATIPSTQLPSQTSRSGPLKRSRDPQEAEEEKEEKDKARMSPPPAKRARHALTEPTAGVLADPNIATVLPNNVSGPSANVATNTEKQEKPVAGRSKAKGKAPRATGNTNATVSPPPPANEQAPAALANAFVPYAGPRRRGARNEWDTDSDD